LDVPVDAMSKENPLIVLRCTSLKVDRSLVAGYTINAEMVGTLNDDDILETPQEELKAQWAALHERLERVEIRPYNTLAEETLEFMKAEHDKAKADYERQISGMRDTIAYLQNELSNERAKNNNS
jgi:hypothetical protein